MKPNAPSPFTAGLDYTNACLNFMHDMSGGYTEGYRLAAELLTNHVEFENRNHGFLVYPICYLYRHHLELQLKQIIRCARCLLNKQGGHPIASDDEADASNGSRNGAAAIVPQVEPSEGGSHLPRMCTCQNVMSQSRMWA